MTLKFALGQVVGTPGALEALAENSQTAAEFLARHQNGDWGDLDRDDRGQNDQALVDGSRIFSAYILKDGHTKVWIITESDRSSTCILLPEEY